MGPVLDLAEIAVSMSPCQFLMAPSGFVALQAADMGVFDDRMITAGNARLL